MARSSGLELLTEREISVLKLLAEGCTNREISERLGISVNTVKGHVGSILLKLDARSRVAAVVVWVQRHAGADPAQPNA
ncbi:MAG: response regulator transcription factor [Hyphomicrobiales bacterium]